MHVAKIFWHYARNEDLSLQNYFITMQCCILRTYLGIFSMVLKTHNTNDKLEAWFIWLVGLCFFVFLFKDIFLDFSKTQLFWTTVHSQHSLNSRISLRSHFLASRVYASGIRIPQGGLVLDRRRVLLASPTVGRVLRYTLDS